MSEQKSPRERARAAAVLTADDTIAAIATAPGRGAVAMVRVSGPRAFEMGASCLTPWPLAPRRATLVTVRAPRSTEIADRAVATGFPGPHSYTGEPVLEISTHGGAVAPTRVLAAFISAGARLASPGEFTRRAVLNGKMDLLQAEALGDLIDAPTSFVHRAALEQLSGALTNRIASLRDALLELEVLLAYDIDFPEEDEGPVAGSRIEEAAVVVGRELDRLLSTLPAARLGREGAVIVLAGLPNTGKSSLFNALLGESRAIVTEHAGTTRDAIDALVEAEPYPWRLVDTAGLRNAVEQVERLGVEVSRSWIGRADVALVCGATAAEREAAVAAVAGSPAVVVRVHTMSDVVPPEGDADVAVSAVSGAGLDDLRAAIGAALILRHPRPPIDTPIIVRARHEASLSRAREELSEFQAAWRTRAVPATIAAVHVRAAVHALETLIGAVDADEVLSRLFERFCVGK